MKIKRTAKKYNDLLIAAIIVFSMLVVELTMLFFNNLFFLNFFGVMNDILFYLIIVVSINFIKNVKLRKTIFTVVFSLVTILFIMDSIYSAFFSGFTSIDSLHTAGNLFIKTDIGVTVPLASFILALEAVICIFFVWFIKVENTRGKKYYRNALIILLAVAIGVGSVNTTVFSVISNKKYESKLDYYASNTFLYNNFYNSYRYIETYGYINYRIRDISFKDDNSAVIDDITAFYDGFDSTYQNELTGIFEGYNLITVLCETLDTRIVNKNLMPNFAAVMEDSLIFENYYVPAYFEAATINTEYMSLTGMYPICAKSWVSSMGDQYKNNYFKDYSMPAQLKESGYETYYMHLGYESFYSRGNLMPNLGFDHSIFVESLPYNSNFYDIEMVDFLDNIDFSKKFYTSMLTYSMHTGSDGNFATNNTKSPNYENYKYVKQNYPNVSKETQIYYTKARLFDDFVGLLFDRLENEGVLDNTVVLFYPDHYAYGYKKVLRDLDLNENDKEIHHQFLTMYMPNKLKTDLLSNIEHSAYKDYNTARSTSLLCSTVDLTPTLLNLFTTTSNYKYFSGQDIFAGNNYVFFSDYTVFDGEVYYDLNQNISSINPLSQDELDRHKNTLSAELERYIETTLMHKLMLDLDYFRKIKTT